MRMCLYMLEVVVSDERSAAVTSTPTSAVAPTTSAASDASGPETSEHSATSATQTQSVASDASVPETSEISATSTIQTASAAAPQVANSMEESNTASTTAAAEPNTTSTMAPLGLGANLTNVVTAATATAKDVKALAGQAMGCPQTPQTRTQSVQSGKVSRM